MPKKHRITFAVDEETFKFLNTMERKLQMSRTDVIIFSINLLRFAYYRGLIDKMLEEFMTNKDEDDS